MNHHATPDFWACYNALPENIRQTADEAYERLKRDSRHPGTRLKKVGDLWSARIGLSHRALAVEAPDGLTWFWIGTHAEYDKLLG